MDRNLGITKLDHRRNPQAKANEDVATGSLEGIVATRLEWGGSGPIGATFGIGVAVELLTAAQTTLQTYARLLI